MDQSLLGDELPLALEQLLLEAVQLLLPRLHRLVLLQDALAGLEVVALHLLHLGTHPLDHLRLPLPQLLHLRAVVVLQLLLQLPHPQLATLLLLDADVRELETADAGHLLLQLQPAAPVHLRLVLQEARLRVLHALQARQHLLLVAELHLAQPALETRDALLVVGLRGSVTPALQHAAAGHSLQHQRLEERLLALGLHAQQPPQLLLGEVVLAVVGLGREDCQGVEEAVRLEVPRDEGIGELAQEGLVCGRGRQRLGVLELADDFLAQLQLHVVHQLVVLPEGVQQLLLVQVLFVHYRTIYYQPALRPNAHHYSLRSPFAPLSVIATFAGIILFVMIPASSGDSLDQASQQYSRAKSGYSNQSESSPVRHDLMMKNLYRQQLDDLMRQKNEQRRAEKEREQQEREQYNERVTHGREAERMKDLSYKNYYQMLATNQTNIAKNYPDLNQERDSLKDKHIQRGIEEEKQRSQQWWEAEQRRLENARRAYRSDLDGQLNEKNNRQANETESRVRQQQEFKKITFTPQEVAQYERERKLVEMSKYKQDLDKLTPTTAGKAQVMTGNAIVSGSYATSNDFNTHQENRHDPMVNPMPYNIQNPYILREFMRKEQARQAQQNIFSGGQRP